jgi:hypothetical protein
MITGRNERCMCGSGLKFKKCCMESTARREVVRTVSNKTYWNGEKRPCTRVRVIVGSNIPEGWWCTGLAGTEREAVRVGEGPGAFYLDNENGSAWLKVTLGRGSPRLGHSSLPVEREVGP